MASENLSGRQVNVLGDGQAGAARRGFIASSVLALALLGSGAGSAGPAGGVSELEWCGVSVGTPLAEDGDYASSGLEWLPLAQAEPGMTYEITILFFYTLQFADDFRNRGHMEDEIETAVDLLNQALEDSRINARSRIVGIEQLAGMPDKQERAFNMLGTDGRARHRRDELEADLVYALVDDPSGFLGYACQPSHFEASQGEQGDGCFMAP